MVRSGRRPGQSDTRAAIMSAARAEFAARGYGGSTIRGIAHAAGVDPALVHHYFGNKRKLFVAALGLPLDPLDTITIRGGVDPEQAGERLARELLAMWESDQGAAMIQALLRSALTDEETLRILREFMLKAVVTPVVSSVAPDRHSLRAALLASQIIGLAMVRYVLRVEPLASADADTVVEAVAPTLQRYLTGDLDGP